MAQPSLPRTYPAPENKATASEPSATCSLERFVEQSHRAFLKLMMAMKLS